MKLYLVLWQEEEKEAQLLDATADERKKIVKGNNVILDNLSLIQKKLEHLI